MAYEPINWLDLPSEETPIDADNLNHMDAQIKANADFIDNIGGTVPTQQELLDLKMLGWAVPKEMTVQNYIDDNGVFHQKVGRVPLWQFPLSYSTTNLWFAIPVSLFNGKGVSSNNEVANIYSSIFKTTSRNNIEDMCIAINTTPNLLIKDTRYTDTTAFNNAIKQQNVYLHYELATEILIPTDGNEATTNQMLSDEWSSATTYAQGDFAIYKNKLWKSKVASNLNHEPEEGSYWTETKIANELRYSKVVTSEVVSGNYGTCTVALMGNGMKKISFDRPIATIPKDVTSTFGTISNSLLKPSSAVTKIMVVTTTSIAMYLSINSSGTISVRPLGTDLVSGGAIYATDYYL